MNVEGARATMILMHDILDACANTYWLYPAIDRPNCSRATQQAVQNTVATYIGLDTDHLHRIPDRIVQRSSSSMPFGPDSTRHPFQTRLDDMVSR